MNRQVRQRADGGQREQPAGDAMHPMQQCVLLDCDAAMVAALLLENVDRPASVAVDECRILPGPREQRARQRFDARTQGRDIVGAAQMLPGIEHPQVPIDFRGRRREIEQRRHHRQVPAQLRRGARPQPLSLPILALAAPEDRADRADHGDFGNGPQGGEGMQPVARAVPAERERHHGTQHGDRAQQIDRPEAASIAVSVVDRALIELPVRLRGGVDQRLQRCRRPRHRRRRQRLQMCAYQQ